MHLTKYCIMAAAFLAAASPVQAQEAKAPTLALELNDAQASDKGCRLTFVVTNNLGAELTKASSTG